MPTSIEKLQPLVHILSDVTHTEKDAYIAKILSRYPAVSESFGVTRYDLRHNELRDVLSHARTFPFGSDVQILIVAVEKGLSASDEELLAAYVADPALFSVLLFYSYGKLTFDGKSDRVVTLSFDRSSQKPKDRDSERAAFITELFRDRAKKISRSALELFVERGHEDRDEIAQYVEAVSLYAGARELITDADVAAMVREAVSYGPFDLANALIARQIERMMEIVRDICRTGGTVYEIVGTLHGQLRKVYEAKIMLMRGDSRESIQKAAKVGMYFLDKFIADVNAFRLRDIEQAILTLADFDRDSKSGRIDPAVGLEMYVMSFARGRG